MPGKTEQQSEHRPQNMPPLGPKPRDREYYEQRNRDMTILQDSLSIGVVVAQATDKLIQPRHYMALHEAGYIDFHPEEVYRVFDEWDIYQSDVQLEYQEVLSEERDLRSSILSQIDKDRVLGSLPPKLFNVVEKKVSEKANSNKNAKRRKDGTLIPDMGVIHPKRKVSKDERIIRYTRYKLAERLLDNTDVSQARLTSIAMGIFLKDDQAMNGSLTSSYNGEIRKVCNDTIDYADIELAVDRAGWYDYIYPYLRENYHSKIRKITRRADGPIYRKNLGKLTLDERIAA